jgi:hypothetical protein
MADLFLQFLCVHDDFQIDHGHDIDQSWAGPLPSERAASEMGWQPYGSQSGASPNAHRSPNSIWRALQARI